MPEHVATGDKGALVVFTPSGRRGRVPIGTPLLQAARSLGVDIDSVCGGRGLCGRCQVLLAEGNFAKHGVTSRAEHLSPFGAVDINPSPSWPAFTSSTPSVSRRCAVRRRSCTLGYVPTCCSPRRFSTTPDEPWSSHGALHSVSRMKDACSATCISVCG